MGRRLYAGVDIAAPAELVWRALTDYEHLDTFIPGAWLSSLLGAIYFKRGFCSTADAFWIYGHLYILFAETQCRTNHNPMHSA